MASSKETYCLCGQPYNIGQFMIECDCCREWFHGSCVVVKIYQSDDIDKYHCPKCEPTYGPSVLKIPTNNHRADRYELGAESRPSQVGTPAWVTALCARPLRPTHAALHRMRPQQFTEEFVRDNGFSKPVLFSSPEGLDMKTPNPATFTARSVLRYCGAQLEVEVIDVRKQSSLRMPLGDFIEYFETPPPRRDEKVLNVLSLEFSDTNLSQLVDQPATARALDWAELVWPNTEDRPPRPAVQKYCLMSAAGSYTDFHVDFGGTTVWYHIMNGRKIFYLIPPTATNLALYQQWCASNNQNERFFGDMVEWYSTVELTSGQTLFIPSGWIHAVLTPCDTLVFGGNLLHSYAIEMQLQIYEIERRVETPTMFRYPLFEAMNWYAGAYLLTMLRRYNEESQDEDFTLSEAYVQTVPPPLPPLLLRGMKLLSNALKEWHALKSTDTAKRDNVPKCLNSGQLVRELCKELRTLEKRSLSIANKDKDYKIKTTSPKKSTKTQQRKSLKLTLPKPVMHVGQNGDFTEEKKYDERMYLENKEVVYQDNRFIPQDVKYMNGLPDTKFIVDGKEVVLPEKYAYQSFEEVPYDGNGYLDRQDKKGNGLRIKINNSPSSSREEPPPYPLPEHSILKSHLIRTDRPKQQWTISKKDIGDYNEEILFTNENLQANMQTQELSYGPGMYSAEDIQPEYQYTEDKSQYPQNFTYHPPEQMASQIPQLAPQIPQLAPHIPQLAPHIAQMASQIPQLASQIASQIPIGSQQLKYEYEIPTPVQQSTYTAVTVPEPINGGYQQLPSYDAAIAQQYGATNYQSDDKPWHPPHGSGGASGAASVATSGATGGAVRRSERPARRRVSNTYDYEDGDLYIDDAPPPARRRNKTKHYKQASNSNYRQPARLAPANGIESLIQASVLAEEEPDNATEDAAVAGMLSISSRFSDAAQHCDQARTFGLADVSAAELTTTPSGSKRSRKTAPASADEELSEEEDFIKEVHRDEEYVYPSLEMSSDEDEEWTSSRRRRNSKNKPERSKSDKDESWSPRARLGRLVPRARGSPRPHVRRESVLAALSAASLSANAKRAVIATKSKRPPPPAPPPPSNKNLRLKKGMKTAKQRLGKILKIHKMIY